MPHANLVLSIVPSFCLLNRNFPPNNLSSLSIFNYRLGLSYLTDCWHAAVSCHWSTHIGSKQSCVNCVNFDSPKINKLHAHYATEHALVLIDEKIISSRKYLMINESIVRSEEHTS